MADFYLRRDSDNHLIKAFNGKTRPVAPAGHTFFSRTEIRAVYAESAGPIILNGIFTGSVYTPPSGGAPSRIEEAAWSAHNRFLERRSALISEGRVWSKSVVDIALDFEAMAYRGFYLIMNATNATLTDAVKTNYANNVGDGPSDGETAFNMLKTIADDNLSAPTDPISYANATTAVQGTLNASRALFTGAGITGSTIPVNTSIASGNWINSL